jgi:hypothetical protein
MQKSSAKCMQHLKTVLCVRTLAHSKVQTKHWLVQHMLLNTTWSCLQGPRGRRAKQQLQCTLQVKWGLVNGAALMTGRFKKAAYSAGSVCCRDCVGVSHTDTGSTQSWGWDQTNKHRTLECLCCVASTLYSSHNVKLAVHCCNSLLRLEGTNQPMRADHFTQQWQHRLLSHIVAPQLRQAHAYPAVHTYMYGTSCINTCLVYIPHVSCGNGMDRWTSCSHTHHHCRIWLTGALLRLLNRSSR